MVVEVLEGEVVDFPIGNNVDTYSAELVNNKYAVYVQTRDSDSRSKLLLARPYNINISHIPIIGEHVLLIKLLHEASTTQKTRYQWYYLPPYPLHSNINENALNINVISDSENIGSDEFTPKKTPTLQLTEGDIALQGRYGNTIRLGSMIKNSSLWTGNNTDPIIILRNSRSDNTNTFSIENIEEDDSSLYLTSTQQVNSIKLAKKLSTTSTWTGSQFIGSAGRIILQSKSDSIILDSRKKVVINTDKFLLGTDSASVPFAKADILERILMLMINSIESGVIGPAGITSVPLNKSSINSAKKLLKELKSTKYFFDEE